LGRSACRRFALFDAAEMQVVGAVKSALDRLITDLPDGQDDAYIGHPGWPQVTAAAAAAYGLMVRR
jgi:hypothetical protein